MAVAVSLAVLAALVAVYALFNWKQVRDQSSRERTLLASRVTELRTVHAAGRELAAALDPERIASIVEREFRKAFPLESFFMGTCGEEDGKIEEAVPAPMSEALVSWILRDKRSLVVDDLGVKAEPSPRPPFAESAAGSLLAVPLLVGERPLGIISIHRTSRAPFDEPEVSFVTTIAQQAAIALERARGSSASTRDALTGLPLREEFLRRLEHEYVRAKRYPRVFSLLILDLDGFKEVNEQMGHAACDRYLQELGGTLRSRLRAADTSCRYGDDEICILLPETEFDAAEILAERLRQMVARLVVDVNGRPVRTTASVGIASYPNHDNGTVKGLLLRAEQAVHHAKRAGRNRVA